MSLITWSDDYSIHVPHFDLQHQKIVELINSLHDTMKHGGSRKELDTILNELVVYTGSHFKDEEEFMAAMGYDDLEAHRKAHQALIADVEKFCERFEKARTPELLAPELLTFLKGWLATHIQKEDRKYGAFSTSRSDAAEPQMRH